MTELRTLKSFPRAVIFDLDGTLVESRVDLAIAVNHIRARCGLADLDAETIRTAIGEGARSLVAQCLPRELEPRVDELMPEFHRFYDANCTRNTTRLPGAVEVLEALHGRTRLALLTNKPKAPSLEILRHLGLLEYFEQVVGGECFATKKPHPQGINWILASFGVAPAQAVMVGDGVPDVEVARAAGVCSVAVLDGIGLPDTLLAREPDYSISTLEGLLELPFMVAF